MLRPRKSFISVLKYVLLSVYAIFSLYPLLWLILYSFKSNEEIFSTNVFGIPKVWHVDNYLRAFTSFNIAAYFKNSLIVTAFTMVLTVLFALMFSYATARMKWKLSDVAKNYLSIGLFIPVQVILIPVVIIIRDVHLANTYFSIIIPYVAFQLGFSSIVFYGFFKSLPYELEEAASIDGASVFTAFFCIIVPLVKSAVSSMMIFIALFAWNEFTVALIVINKDALKTLPLGLVSFKGRFETDWGGVGASLVIASIPTIILYLIFSEQVEKALTVGGAVKA